MNNFYMKKIKSQLVGPTCNSCWIDVYQLTIYKYLEWVK